MSVVGNQLRRDISKIKSKPIHLGTQMDQCFDRLIKAIEDLDAELEEIKRALEGVNDD